MIIFCITLSIFLLLFSYKIALNFSALENNQEKTIDFLYGSEDVGINYTSAEMSHLEDVKVVMKWIDYLFYSSLLLSTLVLTYFQRRKDILRKMLKYGGITTISLSGTILLFSLISFNFAFTMFHKIFFPQGNWTFPKESLLIQTFPLDFFIGISGLILILTIILGIIFILANKVIKNVYQS